MPSRNLILLTSVGGAILGALLMQNMVPDTGVSVPPRALPPPAPVLAPAPIVALPPPAPIVQPKVAPAPPPEPDPPTLGDEVYVFEEGEDPFAIQNDYIYPADVRGIAQAVKDQDLAIQECFQTSKALDGNLTAGKLLIKFLMVTSEDGESTLIENLELDENPGENILFEGCLSSVFESVPFRAPRAFSGDQEMRWPIFLK